MKNIDIREAAKKAGVKLWKIAEKLGKTDCQFSRMLRHELTDGQKAEIMEIIDLIQHEKEYGMA